MRQFALTSLFTCLCLFMGATAWGQAGTLSFTPLANASNGLHRVAVDWSGYASGQNVVKLNVEVVLFSTNLIYLDRDATSSPLGFAGAASAAGLTYSAAGYTSNSYTMNYTVGGFNTSSYPTTERLFIINYAATPDCNSTTDTTANLYFSTTVNGYYRTTPTVGIYSPALSNPITSPLVENFRCNYVSGAITSPFGDLREFNVCSYRSAGRSR